MLAVAVNRLPEGQAWSYELKFDGYRAICVKADGQVRLLSRNGKEFTALCFDRARIESGAQRYRDRWRDRRIRRGWPPIVQRPAKPSRRRAQAATLRIRFDDAPRPGSDT